MALVCSSVYLSLFCTLATTLVIQMDVSFLQHDVDRAMKEDLMQCQVRTSLSYTILELSVVKSHTITITITGQKWPVFLG
jgi:hypothetical protein